MKTFKWTVPEPEHPEKVNIKALTPLAVIKPSLPKKWRWLGIPYAILLIFAFLIMVDSEKNESLFLISMLLSLGLSVGLYIAFGVSRIALYDEHLVIHRRTNYAEVPTMITYEDVDYSILTKCFWEVQNKNLNEFKTFRVLRFMLTEEEENLLVECFKTK